MANAVRAKNDFPDTVYFDDWFVDVDISEMVGKTVYLQTEYMHCYPGMRKALNNLGVIIMYNGDHKEVELICDNSVMDAIIDKFGEGVKVYANDMDSFRIIVNLAVSHIFYSWVFGFGGKVKIKAPADVKTDYVVMVQSVVASDE